LKNKKHSAIADMDGDTFSWCVTENKELSETKVNIVSVYRFKGLDRKVVIVTDMHPLAGDIHKRASNETKRFVVATRAKERLIVLRRE